MLYKFEDFRNGLGANLQSGHGGSDLINVWHIIDCLRTGLPLDQDVYDAAAYSSIVELEDRCRQQQVNEGHFLSFETVPQKAISMSVRQVMKAKNIICFVPDQRKAEAVRDCLEEEISKWHPVSILRKHPATYLYLDKHSASLLSN